jgi:NitT/TauT family transport system substrate-binding protein
VIQVRNARWMGRVVAGTLAAALVLGAAACGSDDADTSAGSPTTTTGSTAPPGTTPVDPFAPQPLAERTTFKVGLIASGQEPYAPAQLALELGEFEKENLDVEISVMTIQDAALALDQGTLDAAPLVLTAGVLNQLATGPDFRLGAGLPSLPPSSKAGVWVRSDHLGPDGTMDPCEFEGMTIGFGPALTGTTAAAGLLQELERCDLTLDDITPSPLQGPDANLALETGALDAAVVFDPLWQGLEQNGVAGLVVPLYAEGAVFEGTSPTGWFFSSVRDDDPDAVKAFMRAVGRTTRDHFQGDYHKDPATVALLAKVLGVPETYFASTPSLLADPTLPVDVKVVETMQGTWLAIGLVEYDQPLPLGDVVDTTLQEEVFGGAR